MPVRVHIQNLPLNRLRARTFADQFAYVVRLFAFAANRWGHHAGILLLMILQFALLNLDHKLFKHAMNITNHECTINVSIEHRSDLSFGL